MTAVQNTAESHSSTEETTASGGSTSGQSQAWWRTKRQEQRERRQGRGRINRFGSAFANHGVPLLAILLLIAVLFILYLWHGFVVIIRAGEAGALYRPFGGGTVTDYVYPEGLHILKPWNSMHIYNTRIQTVLHQFDVLTNKGLTISLTLAIRYHPEREMVGLLHQKVGPDYVQTIVVPQVESVLRRNIGKHDPEDIYTNKEGILTDIIVKAIEEAGQKFVYIDDIIIRTVALPEQIRKAIKEKLVHQQRWYAYEYILAAERQEAERKRIESQGIRDYQATINETLTSDLILWQGIEATRLLAGSENAKIVVIGAGDKGLPVILGADAFQPQGSGSAGSTVTPKGTGSDTRSLSLLPPGAQPGSTYPHALPPSSLPSQSSAGATPSTDDRNGVTTAQTRPSASSSQTTGAKPIPEQVIPSNPTAKPAEAVQ